MVIGGLIVLVLGVVGYVAWYAVQSLHTADAIYAGNATIADNSAPRLVTTTLRYSKLKFTYSSMSWTVQTLTSNIDSTCGKQDSAVLQYGSSVFDVRISFGACGKGGGQCFDLPNSGCVAQSQQLAKVVLSPAKTAYVLGQRTSTDNGKSWNYSIWLTDSAACANAICPFTTSGLENNLGVVFASFEGEGNLPGNPKSLSDFVKLPEVTAAVHVLQTAHY